MRGRLLAKAIAWKLGRLRFPHQRDDAARTKTREIVHLFLLGADLALRGASDETLTEHEATLPMHCRPFFWEGAAFGSAAWRCTALRSLPEPPGPPTYRLMRYTGYGVWNGLARAYHLPEIPSTGTHWDAVSDYQRLRPMMAGGAAFARIVLAGRFDPHEWEAETVGRSDPATGSAIWHGCGRALWFLYMGDTASLTARLDECPRVRTSLLEGVGIAINYTNSESPGAVMARIHAFAFADQRALLRGAGLSLAALVQDDVGNAARVSAIPWPELCEAYALCTWAGQRATIGPGWYEDVVALARQGARPLVTGA